MGRISRLSRAIRADEARRPAVAISKKIQGFYATHMVSEWQREKVAEIREDYQEKQRGLDVAHNIASSKLSEQYMQFELEYLETSDRLKERDGGEPYHHDMRRFISPAFYGSIGRRVSAFFNTEHGKETA